MRKWLVISAVVVVLFLGAKMLTQKETVVRETTHQEKQEKTIQGNDKGSFFSSFATVKELTPAQKKLEELGFYSDRFQSIQVKNKSTK